MFTIMFWVIHTQAVLQATWFRVKKSKGLLSSCECDCDNLGFHTQSICSYPKSSEVAPLPLAALWHGPAAMTTQKPEAKHFGRTTRFILSDSNRVFFLLLISVVSISNNYPCKCQHEPSGRRLENNWLQIIAVGNDTQTKCFFWYLTPKWES